MSKGERMGFATYSIVLGCIRPADSEAKGQRTKSKGLGKVLDETKTQVVVPGDGAEPVPDGCTQELR